MIKYYLTSQPDTKETRFNNWGGGKKKERQRKQHQALDWLIAQQRPTTFFSLDSVESRAVF